VLPISEGIVETQANLNLTREITWQHDTREPWRQHEWQQFMTRSKSRAGSYLTLVPSFTRLPRWTHRGWPDTIPYNIHKEVGYYPTRWHTKLLSLRDPIKSHMRQYPTQTCSSGLDDRSLTDTGGGYHFGAPNFRSDHSSSFSSSILHFPLIAPPGLQLCHFINYSSSQLPLTNLSIKALNLTSEVCHSSSTGALSTKHSTTNGFSTTIGQGDIHRV
jgi:hypothetical protein